MAAVKTAPQEAAQAASTRPLLVIPFGRGARGKTVFVCWAAEHAQDAGRPVVLADADRTNATLPLFFGGVLRPEYADDDGVVEWLGLLVEQQASGGQNVLLDIGGGDLLMKQTALRLQLVRLLDRAGIRPVAVHLVGPDRDDLAVLRDVEESGAFCPADTVLVFNDGLASSQRNAEVGFEQMQRHEVVTAAIARGAQVVRMPRLDNMADIRNRRLTFHAAMEGRVKEGQTSLGLLGRQMVALWWEDMARAFRPVAEVLP